MQIANILASGNRSMTIVLNMSNSLPAFSDMEAVGSQEMVVVPRRHQHHRVPDVLEIKVDISRASPSAGVEMSEGSESTYSTETRGMTVAFKVCPTAPCMNSGPLRCATT